MASRKVARVASFEFWASGSANLGRTLEPFSRTIGPTDRVIEIGCGIARLTRALADRAGDVVGVDVSKEMVDRAREALAERPPSSKMTALAGCFHVFGTDWIVQPPRTHRYAPPEPTPAPRCIVGSWNTG